MRSNPTTDTGARPVTGRTVLFWLLGFFMLVAGMNAILIQAAVSTFGGVETESSYKAGLAFAREMTAARAQQDRAWDVRATLAPDGKGGQRAEIVASDAAGRPLTGLDITVRLTHPTDRRSDQAVAMTRIGAGRFSGDVALAIGQWDLVIELERNGERVFRSKNRVILR